MLVTDEFWIHLEITYVFNSFKLLTISAKSSTLDVWQGSAYFTEYGLRSIVQSELAIADQTEAHCN